MDRIFVLVQIIRTFGVITGCGDVGMGCMTIESDPPLDSNESFNIPVNANSSAEPKLLTIITATYDVSKVKHKMMGPFNTIDFTILDNAGAIVAIPLQITFLFNARSSQIDVRVRMRGCRSTTANGGIWDGEFYHLGLKVFDKPKSDFTIQIFQGHSSYRIYIRFPGSSVFETTFNCKSASVWDRYSKYRISEANLISINKGMPRHPFVRFNSKSFSQCSTVLSIEQPDVIPATLGKAYTVSCKVSGVEFVRSLKWTKADKDLIHQEYPIWNDVTDTVIYIVSEVEIPEFSVKDIGTYTCEIGNGLEQKVGKSISLKYSKDISVLPRPLHGTVTFSAQDEIAGFSWLVEGWPLEVDLKCSPQTGVLTDRQSSLGYSPPRIELTVTINPKTAPDVINCTIVNGSDQVLRTQSFSKLIGSSNVQVKTIDKKCVILVCMSWVLIFVQVDIITTLRSTYVRWTPGVDSGTVGNWSLISADT